MGQGSGQSGTPFSCTHEQFLAACREVGFSAEFLKQLPGKSGPIFERRFVYKSPGSASDLPTHLEVAISNDGYHSFFCMLRYTFPNLRAGNCAQAHGLIFVEGFPGGWNDLATRLLDQQQMLLRMPLFVLNVVLELAQEGADAEYETRWEETLEIKSQVMGSSSDYRKMSLELAGIGESLAHNEHFAATILEQAKELQRLSNLCHAPESIHFNRRSEEIQPTIFRGEAYLKRINMIKDLLQNMQTVLANRLTLASAGAPASIEQGGPPTYFHPPAAAAPVSIEQDRPPAYSNSLPPSNAAG
ncbi:hypothetical protein QBC46DRAFT_393718 [Diplogelasinospora grovesii]|uniref:Uncharacterized protein n=1 Tax=Diplogelasinospora grovesii TaxID=303347 RepID=A0AAN6N0Q3_9PEZI|nr:hypothetical protein QBC46DRAFT_393718 [Diplogelasinospora grovesii]